MIKRLHLLALATGVAATLCLTAQAADESGFKKIFNGQDLTGWNGDLSLWSVKDGAIRAQTSEAKPLTYNTFLVYTNGDVKNFELRFSYKIVGNNPNGQANSGVQYRSKVVDPAKFIVGGYQADFEAGPTYSGILYEERGKRQIMAQRGQKVVVKSPTQKNVVGEVGKTDEIQAKIKKEDWNEYEIIVHGNHFIHKINGVTTVDVTDEDPENYAKSGVLALQVHTGPPMTVEFKNLRIKQLPD